MRGLVIDDERLVLEGLEALLHVNLPDLTLDKTPDLGTGLQLAASVAYEVVLLDWNLSGPAGRASSGGGEQLVQALRAAGSRAPIIVVSGDDRRDWAGLVLRLGLSGFVPKTAGGPALIEAIELALKGGVYLAPLAHRDVPGAAAAAPPAPSPTDILARYPELTSRQAEVFSAMIPGLSDKQIARKLDISESTVKTHVRTILNVVGVARRHQAAWRATAGTSR